MSAFGSKCTKHLRAVCLVRAIDVDGWMESWELSSESEVELAAAWKGGGRTMTQGIMRCVTCCQQRFRILNLARGTRNVAPHDGVEPITHDDITTRMCAAVGTSITSVVVIFIGYIVSKHRGTAGPYPEPLSDRSVCEIMLLSFIFCYTLIFTVMEPLRASIKAVYVCFAQHPQSLSQAFPLIFHRLSRISQANASEWTSGNAVV